MREVDESNGEDIRATNTPNLSKQQRQGAGSRLAALHEELAMKTIFGLTGVGQNYSDSIEP